MLRRTALRLLGGGAAALAARHPLWAAAAAATGPRAHDEFFIFIHASGGWDVTLWADPRNERKGLVEPASTDNTEIGPVTHWKSVALDGDTDTFEPLAPSDSRLVLGPGIGALYDLRDRLTIINGLAMNTVSHPDGTAFSATGRHLAGGRVPASSIDVAVANELGTDQLLPAVAIQFPSAFVGDRLDRRSIPLRVACAGAGCPPGQAASSAVRAHRFVVDRMAIAGYRLRLPGRLRTAERSAQLVAAGAARVVLGTHGQLDA